MSRDQAVPGGAAPAMAGAAGPRISVLHDGAPVAGAARPRAASDAVRACTMTLVALVAWVITPPAAVLLFSTVGLVGVLRSHRADKVVGHCSLGRPKLIVAYLSVAWLLGAWFTVAEVAALMT
jgi:hypothetical protein